MNRLKTYEGFFDFFKKKLSDDDKIAKIYIDRLKKVKGVSPYDITYTVDGNFRPQNPDSVEMRKININFDDTPINIIRVEITDRRFNRYTDEIRKQYEDDGAVFENSRTFYLLRVLYPHNEYLKPSREIMIELFNLAEEVSLNDKEARRIKNIRDQINPAADLIDEE